MEGQDDAYGQAPLPEELPNPRSSPPLPVHSIGPKIVHCRWCTSAECAERDCGQRVWVPARRVRTAIDRRVTGEIDRGEKSPTVVSPGATYNSNAIKNFPVRVFFLLAQKKFSHLSVSLINEETRWTRVSVTSRHRSCAPAPSD